MILKLFLYIIYFIAFGVLIQPKNRHTDRMAYLTIRLIWIILFLTVLYFEGYLNFMFKIL